MDVAASNYSTRSCVDCQPQYVAPPARFAGDDPVSAAPVDVSDAIDAIASRNSYGVLSIDTPSAIDTNAIAINSNALCNCDGNDRGRQRSQAKE
jgi:hypothetical protein